MNKLVTINGISLVFEDTHPAGRASDLDYPASDDVVLFVHGHPFNRSMWRPQMAALKQAGWRGIAPDLRGYGDTQVVPGKTTLDVFAQDLVGLLDMLRIERAVLVGLSMGGQIVMEMARLFQDRVRAIVLAATFPQADSEEGRLRRHRTAARLLDEGMEGYAVEVLPKMIAPRNVVALPDVAEHVLGMMRSTQPAGAAAALLGRAERPSYEPVLESLAVPALVVVGDEDAFTTRADANRMHALLAGSRLVWMERVGHMPNLERADAFNAELVAFLSGVLV